MPFVKVSDVQVYYQVPSCLDHSDILDDTKPTIVLLHPRFFDSYFFIPQFRESRLARGYNLITFDHHYHGKTRAPLDDEPYDLKLVAKDMLSAMKALKISRAHILGVSLGYQIAVTMQSLAPENVLSLVLCGLLPEYETDENMEQYRYLRDACCERADDGSDHLPSDVVHGLHWIYFGETESAQILIEEWVATSNFRPSNRNLFVKIFSSVLDHKPFEPKDWSGINCPVLVIHGAKDVVCSEKDAREIYNMIGEPSKEIYFIPDAPHFLSWTHPMQMNKLAADFFDRVAAVDSREISQHAPAGKTPTSETLEKSSNLVKKWFTRKTSQHF